MLIYILLLIIISIAVSAVFFFSGKLPKYTIWIVLLGSTISFVGVLASQMMSFMYALLFIFGLSFATAILLAKKQEAE